MKIRLGASVVLSLGLLTQGAASASTHLVLGSASSPIAAVKAINTYLRVGGGGCRPANFAYWQCVPITSRLDRRFAAIERYRRAHHMNSSINVLNRTQNYAIRNTFRLLSNNGRKARVLWSQYYGMNTVVRLTWVVRRGTSGWRLDNSFCSGRPDTDLYRNKDVVRCV